MPSRRNRRSRKRRRLFEAVERLEARRLLAVTPIILDFDGDGRDDVGGFDARSGRLDVFRNDGASFAKTWTGDIRALVGKQSPLVGDFDGDGRDDMASFDAKNRQLRVFLNHGDWFGGAGMTWSTTLSGGREAPVVSDFDGDGIADVATFARAKGDVFVSRGDGAGGFTSAKWHDSFPFHSGFPKAGDVDSDGRVDLVSARPGSFDVAVARSTGTSFAVSNWRSGTRLTTPRTETVLVDANADGHLDIGYYDRRLGTLRASLADGQSFRGGTEDLAKRPPGSAVPTGDFGGAGIVSLLPSGTTFEPSVAPSSVKPLLTLPGITGQLVDVKYEWTSRHARGNNELGIYLADDSKGTVNGILPGQAGYRQAVLSSTTRQVVFASGTTVGEEKTLTLPAGSHVGMYLVSNGTTKAALKRPLPVFFSTQAATTGKTDHFRDLGAGRFGWEDTPRGGDRDFNDLVGRILLGKPFGGDRPHPEPCDFDPASTNWSHGQTGGTSQTGGVSITDCHATLREGDSFVVEMSREITVPSGGGVLLFSYSDLAFDTASGGLIKDAFEVAFVDRIGRPILKPYAPGRDAFFNITEGLAPVTGSNAVTVTGATVSVDLHDVPVGETGRLVFRLVNNDADSGTSVRIDSARITASGPVATKFYVADASAGVFRHGTDGSYLGTFGSALPTSSLRGASSIADGSSLWTISAEGLVGVQRPDGTVRGTWRALGLVDPEGIEVAGNDIWVVDASLHRALRFADTATKLTGETQASVSFDLAADNVSPSGIATDGTSLFVSDDATDSIFVYGMDGALAGVWRLDPANADASDLTTNPAGGTALWVVDRGTKQVYRYDVGTTWRTGSHISDGAFSLAAGNAHPEGIADPPEIAYKQFAVPGGAPIGFAFAGDKFVGSLQGDGVGIFFATDLDGGNVRPFASSVSVPGNPAGEHYVACSVGLGGFPDRDVYVAAGNGVLHIDNAGLGGDMLVEGLASAVRGLCFDTVGTFGHDLLVTTNGGQVYRISSDGRAVLLASVGEDTEGLDVAPLGAGFGAFDGHLIVASEGSGTIRAISPAGVVSNVATVEGGAEQLSIVPLNLGASGSPLEGMYAANYPTSIIKADATSFKGLEGDCIVTSEYSHEVSRIHWDGSQFVVTKVGAFPNQPEDGIFVSADIVSGKYRVDVTASTGTAEAAPGTVVVLSGLAESVRTTDGHHRPITAVTINGRPVDVLDPTGHFLSAVTVAPGENTFQIEASDIGGISDSTSIVLSGRESRGAVALSQLVDLAGGMRAEYARTSLLGREKVLHAEVAVRNVGQYPAGMPLYVGVRNISDPAVKVLDAAGMLPDGTPYYDFSGMASGGSQQLAPESATGVLDVAFANPSGGRFTYELVFMGVPNRAPSFTTVPGLDAIPTRPFRYAAAAADPDGDTVNYSLEVGPSGMKVDAGDGVVTWRPEVSQTGNHLVVLVARDGRGGTATQSFTVVSEVRPNRPPVFMSQPLGVAEAAVLYRSAVVAIDADGDPIRYSLDAGAPTGMTINETTGVIEWIPAYSQLGDVIVTALADDGQGGVGRQSFAICVESTANRDPVIVSAPVTTYTPPPSRGDGFADYVIDYFAAGSSGIKEPYGRDKTQETTSFWGWSGPFPVDPAIVLGPPPPSPVVGSSVTTEWLSIPTGSHVTVGFEDEVIVDGPGDDIFIRSLDPEDSAGESADIYVSTNLIDYVFLKRTPQGGNVGIDLAPLNLKEPVRAVRVEGVDNKGSSPGFDLVSIEVFPNSIGDPVGYRYAARAIDDQDTPLSYSLLAGPAGMIIDAVTGQIAWSPDGTLAGREVPVTVRVDDGRGGSDEQRFTVSVSNDPPPPPPAVPSVQASYSVAAGSPFHFPLPPTNPSGDVVSYELASGPAGLAVDSAFGIVAWGTRRSDVGSHAVVIKSTDPAGSVRLLPFTINVTQPNTAPVFTTVIPADHATVGYPLEYRSIAQDSEQRSDSLQYSLAAPLVGMQIDPLSGVFSWTPTAGQVGDQQVTVEVSDGMAITTQRFTITVVADSQNRVPVVSLAGAASSARLGLGYGGQAVAIDPDGDPISFDLVAGPSGMTIDTKTGVISWKPEEVSTAPVPVIVRVVDGRGGEATASLAVSVSATDRNLPPVIVSNPPPRGIHGSVYVYDMRATDANSDPVAWRLVSGPPGMSLDPFRGTLRWTPSEDQVGVHPVVIRAIDPWGATDDQAFSIDVSCVNQSPNVVSPALTAASVGTPYLYPVRAIDPEGDPLVFSVESGPAGIAFQAGSSLLSWTPSTNQVGPQEVLLKVVDSAGNAALQSFTILASTDPPNRPPVIVSRPMLVANADREYRYTVEARDPDGDAVAYALEEKPVGMTIDTDGLISWTPSESTPARVTVNVTDARGGIAAQSFTLVPRVNTAPSIVSLSSAIAMSGSTYRGLVRATDPEHDSLLFSMIKGPAGLAIDAEGRVTWPVSGIPRTESFTVAITDPGGLTAERTFDLAVTADVTAPKVRILLPAARVNLGGNVPVQVQASDDVSVASLQLLADGNVVPLDGLNMSMIPAAVAGKLTLKAIATDPSGNVGQTTAEVVVIDPSLTSQVRTAFTRLEEHVSAGAVRSVAVEEDVAIGVGYLTDVYGSVSSAGQPIASWQLLLARSADVDVLNIDPNSPVWRTIGRGTDTLSDGRLGTFDPTLLSNDRYALALVAYDVTGSGYVMPMEVDVVGNAKLGDFRLEFTDVSLPLSGIPITITRVYDTKEAGVSGDFGHGWSLGVRDARIRETVPADQSFEPGKTKVYLTAPDGRRVGFTYEEKQTGGMIFGMGGYFATSFQADPGNPYTLELPDEPQRIRGGVFGSVIEALGGPFNPSRYRLTAPEGTTYDYDQVEGLQKIIDTNGNAVTFSNAAITHSGGRAILLDRDGFGRITSIRLPDGSVAVRYRYDAAGDLVEVKQILSTIPTETALSTTIRYAADRPHYLAEYIDANGNRAIKTEYDSVTGRLKAVTDAMGKRSERDYTPLGFEETVTDFRGNPTRITYDTRGNVVKSVKPTEFGDVVTIYSYDDPRNPDKETRIVDGRGTVTTRSYDAAGNLLTETTPDGTTTYSYDSGNRTTSITDPLGRTTAYAYDGKGNLTTIIDQSGVATSIQYDSLGRMQVLTDRAGNTTTFSDYCSCGRPLTTVNPDGSIRRIKTNKFSQIIEETDERGHVTRQDYDNLGRLTTRTDGEGNVSRYEYTGSNQTKVVDALGNVTRYEYDAFNRQTAIIDAEGGITRFTYDPDGNVESLTDPVGNVTRYVRDADGRVREEIDPAGVTKQFEYDAAGNVTRITDRNGLVRTFAYDGMNRQTAENWLDAAGVTVRTISSRYDAVGNLVEISDPDARLTFTFDVSNRMNTATTEYPGKVIPKVTLTYGYDANGNRISAGDTSGVRVDSTYNDRNRLESRTWQGGGIAPARVAFAYYANGGRKSSTRFADATGTAAIGATAYDQFANGLTKSIAHTGPTGVPLATYDYRYDAGGRLSEETSHGVAHAYGYDRTGQLLTVFKGGKPFENFSYDANGNRKTSTGPNGVQTYAPAGPANRLVSDGIHSFAYDREGNLKTKTVIATGEKTEYFWDHGNRLVKVEQRSAGGVILSVSEFRFDPLGRRILETANGVARYTTYDGDHAWADFAAEGTATTRYLYGDEIDEILARWNPESGTGWYLTDKLGSVRDMLNAAGGIVNTVDYSAFGQILAQTNPMAGDRFAFTGREWDTITTGHFRARSLDTTTGRFLSTDPTGFKSKDVNLYRYALNRPTDLTDPSGFSALGDYAIQAYVAVENAVNIRILGFVTRFSFLCPIIALANLLDDAQIDNYYRLILNGEKEISLGSSGPSVGDGGDIGKATSFLLDRLVSACSIVNKRNDDINKFIDENSGV